MGPTETSHRRPQHQPWLPTPSPHAAAVAAAVASNLGSVERVAVGVPAAAKIPPAPTTSRPSARPEPPPPPAAAVTVARTLPAEEKPRPEAAETAGAAPPEEAEGKRKASGGTTALAPGFRFHPTDEELVSYYLKRKVNNKPVRFNAIAEVDIYKVEPWELAEKSRLKTRDQEWYFFSALDRKYGNGARMNRATGKGYWKATGKDREVRRDTQLIAMKKTLVFHSGRAPGGQRTNWVMHEYRLQEEEYEKGRAMLPETFVLCRVFHKNNIGPPNGNRYAPFLEEEWDDGEATVVPGEDAVDDMVAAHETCAETNHVEPDSRSVNKDPASDNDLRKVSPNVLPVCKTEKVDDFAPLCVLNTEAPFPLLQYKRRKNNNDTGSNGSNSSDNSTWINQDPSSSSTTTATTDLMMTTNSATTTAVSALLEFSLMEPVEQKESPYVSPHAFDSSRLDLSIPPSCMKFISDMQSEMQKIAVERDTLRLELMSAQAMINILQSRTDYMRKENEDLKRSLQDTK